MTIITSVMTMMRMMKVIMIKITVMSVKTIIVTSNMFKLLLALPTVCYNHILLNRTGTYS